MTSLEMVDYINADSKAKAEAEGCSFPCKKYRKLEHRSFITKVPKVLGEAVEKFFAVDSYINGTGGQVERDIYKFPKREACLMAMSYSYELQAQVFDHMTELEGGKDINLLDYRPNYKPTRQTRLIHQIYSLHYLKSQTTIRRLMVRNPLNLS